MCIWRMSLQRTKSAIISWAGSIYIKLVPVWRQPYVLQYRFVSGLLSVNGKLPVLKFRYRYIENKQNLDSYLSCKPPHDKTNKMACAPREDSASAQSDQSLRCPHEESLGPTYWAHSDECDQSGRLPRLIRVFTGRTVILLVLSWGGSFSVSGLLQTHIEQ